MASQKPCMNWSAGNLAKEWKRFKQHCQFIFDGPLAEKSEKVKVNYMMTYMGDKGRETYNTFIFAPAQAAEGENPAVPAENETLQGVWGKFDNYFEPRTNNIRATVNFNNRRQGPTEKFDNFVTDLKILVKDCGYVEEERMVRDAIVLRSFHEPVKEKCLDKGDALTLDGAIEIGRNYEAAKDSMTVINKGEDASLNAVRFRQTHKTTHKRTTNQGGRTYDRKSSAKCPRCGYKKHDKGKTCPAKNKKCDFCKKLNHFAAVCRKKGATNQIEYDDDEKVSEFSENDGYDVADEDEEDEDDMFLHPVYSLNDRGSKKEDEWYEEVLVDGKKVMVQLDTGARRCTMPYEIYKTWKDKPRIESTTHSLETYSGHKLPIKGTITVQLSHKDRECDAKFYVVEASDKPPLLSGDVCQKLGLIERVYNLQTDFPQLKKLTGTLPGTYTIKVDPAIQPVVHPPRRLPQALHEKVTQKLNEMEQLQQITKVHEPTDWVNSMVTVIKNDKVRICLDPKDLNKAIRREHYYIPTVEEVVSSMPADSRIFSVIDAKSGFLQIQIDYESSLLTCFNTPIGRFRWLRLPFGIKCAPEIFQRIMDNMLEGIDGARAIMDDILIAARNEKEHDAIMKKVIQRATEYNLKLNFDKCQVKKAKVKYVGHMVTSEGLKADPDKLRAVAEMPPPTDKEGVRRFLGFIQYLAKFIPNLSQVDAPLRELVKKDTLFYWGKAQQQSFDQLKKMTTNHPVLAYYDSKKELTIQCDASSFGIGGVLLQEGRPVAYTSRSMTETEKRYAQIEKEMLAIVHSCKKFHHYIFGRPVKVESDHKPLQSIFKKPLLAAPMRLQTMLLRLQPYDLEVQYKCGTDIPIGDTLSRANLPNAEPDTEPIMVNMTQFISVTPSRYQDFQQRTANELNELHSMILKGWPDTRSETPHSIREYWTHRDELSVSDGIVYKGMRIVVPPSLRATMLEQIHESHLGIIKCKERAREVMFWPGMSQQIEHLVQDCALCQQYQNKQHCETMKSTPHPDLPWTQVASDLFEFEGEQYLLIVDYYSRYITTDKLVDQSSSATIDCLKAQFSQHGIPQELRTDNGPQFSSAEFMKFCQDYQITHITSSPHFPQSNGEAERAVQTVKRLWKKCKDKHLALLDYRTTSIAGINLSPAQLLMGRRPRNKLPTRYQLLEPSPVNSKQVKQCFTKQKQMQEKYHNKKAGPDLPPLRPGDPVRMAPSAGSKEWRSATVVEHHRTPRSYVVESQGRKYRRNRRDIRLSTHTANKAPSFAVPVPTDMPSSPKPALTKTSALPPARPPARSSATEQQQAPRPSPQKHPASTTEQRPAPPRPSPLKSTAQQPKHQKKHKPAQLSTEKRNLSSPVKSSTYITKSGRQVKPPKLLDL